MRHRSSDDNATAAAFVMISLFIAAVSLVLSLLFTFMVYVPPFFIVLGLFVSWVLTGKRPIEKASDLYTQQEITGLTEGRKKLDALWDRKERTFFDADHLGLTPRTHDRTRFDERKPLAKRLNGRLEKLENDFGQTAAEVNNLLETVVFRREQWLETASRWRFYSAGRIATVLAVAGYLVVVLVTWASNPLWAQQLSDSVARHMWLPMPALSAVYGAMVCASLFSTLTMTISWPLVYWYNAPSLAGEQEFTDLWLTSRERDSVEYFVSSYWTKDYSIEADNSDDFDREDEGADGRKWHEILGVAPDASSEEIKAAYREQIKLYHPDRVASLGSKLKEIAERESKALNSAYEQGLRNY